MVSISALWLPILLSAVFVFIASSILHMILPWHRGDCRQLPDEGKVLDALRTAGVTSGKAYRFPYCSMKEMKSPETIDKFKRGPVGMLTILPSGPPAMGKYLGLWFAFCLLTSLIVGCFAGVTQGPGAEHHVLFHFLAVTAFLAYGYGQLVDSIWKGQTWGVTLKHVFDGAIYALVTAETFILLWPK